MVKAISILGSTGSVGRQTLAAARRLGIPIRAPAAGRNIDLLEKQIQEFKPSLVSVARRGVGFLPASNACPTSPLKL
jgi:1-deoxy-D-xylulose-5-phosphate reductoisomerase